MTNQLSKNTDKILNNLSRTIGAAELLIEKGTTKKDEAWEEAFNLLSEFGEQSRFVANDGYSLARQSRQGAPKLDEKKLKEIIFNSNMPLAANKLWKDITEPKVDSKKVEALVKAGKLSAAIVDQCITVPDVTYARVRRVWTKEDVETAAQFGIQIEPVSGSRSDYQQLAEKILAE